MKLCCFFNYAPLYRQPIYEAIDNSFDTQFLFGREVEFQNNSGIEKLDYSIFKKKPIDFNNKVLLHRFLWRTKLLSQLFNGYDTFLITGDLSLSYIPFIIGCKILGKKVYGWGHGLKKIDGKLGPVSWWVLNNLSGFFSYGEGGRKRLIELGYDPDKVFTIYNSLGKESARSNAHQLESDIIKSHFNNTLPTILFIGRLTPQKKLQEIIEAAIIHQKNNILYNILIIGDGPEKSHLQNLVHQNDLQDRIWFYGECYDEKKLNTLIYNCDLCCSPGNVGLTALHAMNYGVPVISHDDFETQMPEYETIVPGKTGLLFKKDNWQDFRDKIAYWISNFNDKTIRTQIRNNCFEMIDTKWNTRNQLRILSEVLKSDVK